MTHIRAERKNGRSVFKKKSLPKLRQLREGLGLQFVSSGTRNEVTLRESPAVSVFWTSPVLGAAQAAS